MVERVATWRRNVDPFVVDIQDNRKSPAMSGTKVDVIDAKFHFLVGWVIDPAEACRKFAGSMTQPTSYELSPSGRIAFRSPGLANGETRGNRHATPGVPASVVKGDRGRFDTVSP